jgi:hypothetical protein
MADVAGEGEIRPPLMAGVSKLKSRKPKACQGEFRPGVDVFSVEREPLQAVVPAVGHEEDRLRLAGIDPRPD